ncbi:interferon-inducible GTPase 5-like protein [Anopheles sinensis]|uniref:Interferon-inducible GTPase 5-like protein n=1 Tax=Anopheles sinensis TaxID=74873 RepID=A0A084WLZ9_ANOSI|nr:interferon-inducible GTPase 5-like protein [Anopheles sinensis]
MLTNKKNRKTASGGGVGNTEEDELPHGVAVTRQDLANETEKNPSIDNPGNSTPPGSSPLRLLCIRFSAVDFDFV